MTVLITGGTRGIGAAIALRLAREGHDLVLGYASDDHAAEETRLAVEDAGVHCAVVRADLTEPEAVDRLFGEPRALTGVVNNAGATLHLGPLAQTPPEVITATVDLNLTAALLDESEPDEQPATSRAVAATPPSIQRRDTGRSASESLVVMPCTLGTGAGPDQCVACEVSVRASPPSARRRRGASSR